MVTLIVQIVVLLTNRRINKLLMAAETALPPEQFRSFRKQFLNEFGGQYRKDLAVELQKQLKEWKG